MKCRIDNSELIPLFSLGNMYVSDFIPMDAKSEDYQSKVPLNLCIGPKSGLVQLAHTADFDKMYKRYWYNSGTNKTMTNELGSIVKSITDTIKFDVGDTWLDIGCNDGTLLSQVPSLFYRVGFDPATNNCAKAVGKGDLIVNDYFNADKCKFTAKVITSIAMFYDLPDPNKFCQDIKKVLDVNGLWVIQMSYLPLMLEQVAFDNICHEHLEYYTLIVLENLLKANGLRIVDVQLNDVNGGSFRIYVRHKKADDNTFATAPYRSVAQFRLESLLAIESNYGYGLGSWEYDLFMAKVSGLKSETVRFIKDAINRGKTVWAYGASTKGNTLLQYFGLDNTMIKGIAERNPEKWGLKTIGSEIPIYSEEYVRSQNPDYMLVLPWHFINEFRVREHEFLSKGGKFIVPCPAFEVIGS